MIVAEPQELGRRENFLTRLVRPIHVPLWLGAEVFGVHLGPEVIDASLRRRWRDNDPVAAPLYHRLLPTVTVPVMMVPLSRSRMTGKSQGPKCGMRQTCHPEALQRAVTRGCSSDGHWRT